MIFTLLELLAGLPLFFALHFDGRTVFPPPLSAAKEREAFRQMREGSSQPENSSSPII